MTTQDRVGEFALTRLLDALLDALCSNGRRKFSAAIAALVLSAELTAWGPLSGAEFVTALGIIFATFTAANYGEHKSKNGNGVSITTGGGSA